MADVEPVNKTDLIINYLGTDYTWVEAIDPVNGPIPKISKISYLKKIILKKYIKIYKIKSELF